MSAAPASRMQLPVPRCTGVMAQLTLRTGVAQTDFVPHMLEEVRATAQLYLEGRIQQWWTLCDAPGVLLLFATEEVEVARAWMGGLPLVKADLVDLSFRRVGPLLPLRLMLGPVTPLQDAGD